MTASNRRAIAVLILVAWPLALPLSATTPAFDLALKSIEFSTTRIVDGGEVTVRVTATTPSDMQNPSCSGGLWITGLFLGRPLPFSSCSARRIGPSQYELVLKRAFPAAVVNRAFTLGELVLSDGSGKRYVSRAEPDRRLEVISTAILSDLTNPRIEMRAENGEQRIRAGGRFRLDFYVDGAAPVEHAAFALNLLARDGSRVQVARLSTWGSDTSGTSWIERVERNRQPPTSWLILYAKVPEDLRRVAKLEVKSVVIITESLQYLKFDPNGVVLDIKN